MNVTEEIDKLEATPAEVFGEDLPPDDGQQQQQQQESNGQQQQEEGQQQGQQGQQQQQQTPVLTAEQIRDSVREGLRQSQPQQQQQQRQYTQEEIDAHFHVWQPSADLVERIRNGGEDALKALVEMRDGMSKQFSRLVELNSGILKEDIGGQFKPALDYVSEAKRAADEAAFFEEHQDLKEHKLLTTTVFNALKAEGFVAKDVKEAYKVLADRTRALLPNGANGSGARQSSGARQTTTTQTRRPAALSSGSQAGGGGGDSAPATGYPGGEVFL
jgi:hypothetical protein